MSAEDVYKRLIEQRVRGACDGLPGAHPVRIGGIVERHNFDDGHSVLRTPAGDHHDHMVDIDTGQVMEFVNERIESLQREIAQEQGLRS